MTKFNFQNATIKTVRLLGVTTIAVTLAAAHPGAHADQRLALVDNANHSDVSTAVGTVNAFHSALANGNTAAALSLRADLAEFSLPQGTFSDIALTADSDSFDLANRQGPVNLGVTVQEIGSTLQTMLGSKRVGTFIQNGEERYVIFEGERTVLIKRRSHWGDK